MAIEKRWTIIDMGNYYAVKYGDRTVAASPTKKGAQSKLNEMKTDFQKRFVHVKVTNKRQAHTRCYPKSK